MLLSCTNDRMSRNFRVGIHLPDPQEKPLVEASNLMNPDDPNVRQVRNAHHQVLQVNVVAYFCPSDLFLISPPRPTLPPVES